MLIGLAKEKIEGEKRVALAPDSLKKLSRLGIELLVEKGAGEEAKFSDADYEKEGAKLAGSFSEVAEKADIIIKVRPPSPAEVDQMKNGMTIFSMLDPVNNVETIQKFQQKGISSYALEFIPRITLAQSMDILSSMATIAGYRAVLDAVHEFNRFMPMLMTAAGTIKPAKVLILGAGVAGLQAISAARRLGAVVEVFDVRPVVKEQVESLGGKFVEMELTEDMQDDQGYAKQASEEFLQKQKELIAKHLAKSDIAITTAQVFGKKAPVLITKDMVPAMRPGSVIIDLAAEQGGNCEFTEFGKTIEAHGVKVMGPENIASEMAPDASWMFSNNVVNLLTHLVKEGQLVENEDDEIVSRTRVVKQGEVVSDIVKQFLTK